DEAGAVDEFGLSALDHGVIFRQGLRRHGQVGIEDHQDVAGRCREALAHGIALAPAVLSQHLDVPTILIGIADALAFRKRIVTGITFDEDNLLLRAEAWRALDGVLDTAALIAARNDDADRIIAVGELPIRAADEISPQAQLSDARQWRDKTVDERPKPQPALRQQLPLLLADHFEVGEV